MKQLLLFLPILFMGLCSNAQKNGVIAGKITESENNFSLPGATVKISSGNRYTISDQIGDFEFLNVPAGNYEVQVIYIGYQPLTQNVVVEEGKTATVNFSLHSGSENLNEVVVTGDRIRGQARALNQQKNNRNITNVISSDQVGRFPDANIGDALKRVPGITMQNDQGEARNIIIRGLAPSLNSVTLNGDRIPSAEGDNRNVQMDLIPSDMISSIEVSKTLTPDMDADAIGGSVNLVTRATPNGQRISATIAGGYGPIREKGIYTAGLVYGNRFLDKKLGAVFSGSINSNNYGSDNIEATWVRDDAGNTYVEDSDIRRYQIQRVRRSFSAAADYKFNANNAVFASAIYNWRVDRENRFAKTYDGMEPEYADEEETVIAGFTGSIKRQTKGGVNSDRGKSSRYEEQKVQNYSLRGEHLLSPTLDMDWSVNYAKAREYKPQERYIEYEQEDLGIVQDLTDTERPFFTAGDEDIPSFEFGELTENTDDTEESEFGARLNFRFPLTAITGQKGRLRTGLRLRLKDKSRNNIFYSYEPLSGLETLADVGSSYFSGKEFNPGSKYIPGQFVSKAFLGGLDLGNTGLFEGELDPSEFLATNYEAKEDIYAGYVRFDQDFNSRLSMIVGVRVESTHIDYTGNRVLDEEELEGKINNTNSYTNVLPNLSFRYEAPNDLVLRAAFTTALARPDYYALAPYVNNIAEDQEISAGNPNLDATFAHNFDFMAEKYFKSVGLVSFGAFYKNLKDFVYTYSDAEYTAEKFASDFPTQANPIPEGESWTLIQSRNGEKVNVYGFEAAFQRQLDFLPGFLKNFGVYANYTFTHSEAKGIADEDGNERKDTELPGTAPHMLNGSLFWENSKFSARISGNYTTDYLDVLGPDTFGDSYYDKQFFLDINASYKITKSLRIFAEANNLTNQPLRYYQGESSRTQQLEFYEPRFNLGLKFDF